MTGDLQAREDATGDDQAAVRPLDSEGRPITARQLRPASPQSRVIAGGALAAVVLLAAIGLLVWRALLGTPFGAAESVPADADMVFTMDFLQVRDTSRVERFIQAFATPMAEHGIIDEIPDFEAALREFDDEAEAELGFRFAEDVFSWIGRSGAIAIWFPDEMFALDAYAAEVLPGFLVSVEVRDEEAARSFLDRMIAQAEAEGMKVGPIRVGGSPGYVIDGDDVPALVTLHNGRFLLSDSVDTLRRGVETEPGDSIAQSDDFQQLSSALAGDPLMTAFVSSSFGTQVASLYDEMGLGMSLIDELAQTSAMSALTLDDDGVYVRAVNRPLPSFPIGGGSWAAGLPADTYGFVDVALPDQYLQELSTMYVEILEDAGFTRRDLDEMTAPADEIIGMSLLDDLLPQLGRELLFAVTPTVDGAFAAELGVDVGLLLGIGVADSDLVSRALDNSLRATGINVVERNGVRVMQEDGADLAAVVVTDNAFGVSSSADLLETFVAGNGRLGTTEQYQRLDDLLAGEGLAMYVNVASIVEDFVTDNDVRDVLAPLVSAGASYAIEGELQISEFRLVVDY